MSDARPVRALGAVILAGALLAGAGCGGDEDPQDGLPARGLVPGGVQIGAMAADTMAVDTTAVDRAAADLAAAPPTTSAQSPVEALVPSPAAVPRREAPRTTDAARQAVPGGPYALQLGSFRSLDNARSLVASIEALGYAPVIESAVVAGQTHHRVLLRGLADRSEASRTGELLRAELGITYLIRQSD